MITPVSASRGQRTVYVIVTFLSWTIGSFLCHFCSKAFLVSASAVTAPQGTSIVAQAAYALELTVVKLVCCFVFVKVEAKTTSAHQMLAYLYHFLATYATNFSLTFLFASSTAAIKLMEPLTSTILQYVYLRQSLSGTGLLTLPCIVFGSLIFIGLPSFSGQYIGIVFGLLSNIFFGLRNVSFKKEGNDDILTLRTSPTKTCLLLSIIALTLLALYRMGEESASLRDVAYTYTVPMAVLAGIFHVTYSFVSTAMVLKEMSVVSHSIANIMKRTLVVVLLYAFGQRVTSPCNVLGLVMCVVGLAVYTWDKYADGSVGVTATDQDVDGHSRNPGVKKRRICRVGTALVSLVLTSLLFFQCSYNSHTSVFGSSIASDLSPKTPFTSPTFYHDAFQRPTDEVLMPDFQKLPPEVHDHARAFLNQRLIDIPSNANYISRQLPTGNDIIRESQRIHFNMIGDALKKYKYAIWVDVSAFENKGDSCVTVGETYFLRRINIKVIYYCNFFACNRHRMHAARNLSLSYSPDELVIIGHGGGNLLGYYRNDNIRYMMIEYFPKFQIFIFPQGIWIPNNDESTDLIKKAKKMYCCVPNLTIVLREKASYLTAKRLFVGSTRLLMSPDIAFQVGPVSRVISPVFDILWLKRNDKEDPGKLKLPPYPKHLSVHSSEWIQWKTNPAGSKLEQAHYNAANGHLYLQRGRVVVTDRLHGHIFSILNDIPHVLVDPLGNKLTNYHKTWTASLHNVRIAKSTQEALTLAIKLLEEYNDTLPVKLPFLTLSEDFKPYKGGIPDDSYI